MQWCQSLMLYQKYKTDRVKINTETPIIASKNTANHSCKLPLCTACQISKMKKPGVNYQMFKTVALCSFCVVRKYVQKNTKVHFGVIMIS